MTPYHPLTSHNGLSAVCVAHIMTPYCPLTSHNGLSAVCVAHIMTPYRPLTSHNVQEYLGGGSTRIFSGGHIDIQG